jgi:catechol 2,3-dioxygenase-like lactoylglutathione lyase family enzyme
MLTHFPKAVPEIPVSNVEKAAEYYVNVLGFHFDWGNDQGGIGGISQGGVPYVPDECTVPPTLVW